MTLSHEVAEKRIDPRGRLAGLLKYASGNAKEIIKPPGTTNWVISMSRRYYLRNTETHTMLWQNMERRSRLGQSCKVAILKDTKDLITSYESLKG